MLPSDACAVLLHMIEVVLAKCLIKHDRHRIAKIQGADIIDHRDTDRRLLILYQNFFRDPGTFFSEHNVTIRLIGHFRVGFLGLGRCHIDLGSRILLQKVRIINVSSHIEIFPVIHPGSL